MATLVERVKSCVILPYGCPTHSPSGFGCRRFANSSIFHGVLPLLSYSWKLDRPFAIGH
ncbi:hypothetical protein BDV11DRAFT_184404 [Aspergillus similis]